MIQDTAPHTYDPVLRRRKPESRDYLLHYEYNKAMLIKGGRGSVIPTFRELGVKRNFSAQAEYLSSIDDRAYYCMTDMKVLEFGGSCMGPLTIFQNFELLHQVFVGVTGNQLCRWMQSRRLYDGCGAKAEPGLKKRALVCPSCGRTEYPKISPAVTVAITNRDELFVSHCVRGACRNYALIAGFVEVGETFKDCVRREAMEEMGLRVKDIRYCKSRPWAFSDTEMVGFTVGLDGDNTICLGEEELCEAGQFIRDEIVEYGPYISVGHEIMKAFRDRRIQQIAAYKRRSDCEP